jgi:hypothetical protein
VLPLESRRDRIFVAQRTGLELKSSFRSDTALPPINGLDELIKAHEFYKYFVPAGLAETTPTLIGTLAS